MVGYNFHPLFEPQVRNLSKLQTVRAPRLRHARPGEPVQLFCDQRSRHCRKLVSPDPICVRVRPIEIHVSGMIGIASIAIEGIPLGREEIELFARADGFDPERFGKWKGAFRGLAVHEYATARSNMGDFWLAKHGAGRFDGVIVQWEPQ